MYEINKLNGKLVSPALTANAKATKAKERDEKIVGTKTMERAVLIGPRF